MANPGAILTKIIQGSRASKLPVNDLDRAYQALSGKLSIYNLLWKYYDGDQPLMYTSRRMDDIFKDLELSKFVENWCAVVIDSANDRIMLDSLSSKDAKVEKQLALDWEDFGLAVEASDVHEAALVIGESFLMIWAETNDEEKDELQVFYNDPRLCHLFYEPGNPNKKRFGAKWWVDSANFVRLTLYYPDRLEYYRTEKPNMQIHDYRAFRPFNPTTGRFPPINLRPKLSARIPMNPALEGALEKLDEDIAGTRPENPYGEVPFFHYRLERRQIKSDLTNAIPLQNGINKLVTDMMVAAEYGAFKQRWIISNADTSSLKNAPNEMWEVPAGDGTGQQSSVGQFEATELKNYVDAIDSLASAIAIISRTPKHYLYGQGGTPSGEALIAMEAPLVKRCQEHIAQFKPVWKDAARFMLKIRGIEIEKRDIVVNFADPETIQPKTQAEIRESGKRAGIPLNTLLRNEGKDDAWIKQMEADKKSEGEASPVLALLDEIRKGKGKENADAE